MNWVGHTAIRIAALLIMLTLGLDASTALAQSAQCSQLAAQLQQLERNGDFRNADRSSNDIRSLQATMQDAQSAYNRGGCMSAQQQGFPQTPECRSYAQQYFSAQRQLKRVQQSAANGDDVAQQREEVLQQIARFGCNQTNSRVQFSDEDHNPQPRHRNFLEELFGGGNNTDYGDSDTDNSGQTNGQDQVEDPYANAYNPAGNTIRTVCVRMSDGYYWPISYSTVRDYIPQDTQACEAQCPNQQVALYYYDNPGQEPEQMVNANGEAYTTLPNAFAYRKNFDLSNTCKPQEATAQASVQVDGSGRQTITYNGETVPLPIPDPRAATATSPAKIVASVDIPLPRPRPNPAALKAAAASPTPPTAEPVVSAQSRLVKVGDKLVRVVGPDTPYAPSTLTPQPAPAGSG